MSGAGSPFRSAAAPAVVAALALALISAAAAGSQPSLPARACDARASLADVETTRLLAAAVAAAKNLLGVDSAAQALIQSEPHIATHRVSTWMKSRPDDEIAAARAPALAPHLIDLPPPIC